MVPKPIVIHIRNWWFWGNQIGSNKTEVEMVRFLEIRWKWSIRHTFLLKKCVGSMKMDDFPPQGGCDSRVRTELRQTGLFVRSTTEWDLNRTELARTELKRGEVKWTAVKWNEVKRTELNCDENETNRTDPSPILKWTATALEVTKNWTEFGWTELNWTETRTELKRGEVK